MDAQVDNDFRSSPRSPDALDLKTTELPTCLCPDVFDPVICTSNGQTYSNFCQAGCAGATGCTRTGDI